MDNNFNIVLRLELEFVMVPQRKSIIDLAVTEQCIKRTLSAHGLHAVVEIIDLQAVESDERVRYIHL